MRGIYDNLQVYQLQTLRSPLSLKNFAPALPADLENAVLVATAGEAFACISRVVFSLFRFRDYFRRTI